jgi:AcrR family transcriptional regulator
LLQAAFREVYRSGFQSAGLDAILAAAGVTKGALYHHFGSKEALGYAIVEEIIAPDNRGQWLRPLQNCEDPIDALIGAVQELSVQPDLTGPQKRGTRAPSLGWKTTLDSGAISQRFT